MTEDRLQALQNASSGAFNLFNKSSGTEGVFTVATAEQQEEAVRVLAAGNALIGLVSVSHVQRAIERLGLLTFSTCSVYSVS